MGVPNIAADIRSYLVTTVGITDQVTIGFLTANTVGSQDLTNQYAVIEYPGPPNTKTHGDASGPGGVVLDEATFQIQVRHKSPQTALTNTLAIVDALDGLKDVTINATLYTWFCEISRPRILDREEGGAVIYIWEFRVQARR